MHRLFEEQRKLKKKYVYELTQQRVINFPL